MLEYIDNPTKPEPINLDKKNPKENFGLNNHEIDTELSTMDKDGAQIERIKKKSLPLNVTFVYYSDSFIIPEELDEIIDETLDEPIEEIFRRPILTNCAFPENLMRKISDGSN